ncbi:hypothetical protein Dimus_006875 [Dionaea muscipula]
MDVEFSNTATSVGGGKEPTMDARVRSRRRRNICVVGGIVFVLIVVVLVIVGLTVFRVKRPVTTINSVSLEDFQFSVAVFPQISAKINVTLATGISIRNPNKLGMKYTNTSAYVEYRGEVVGEAPVPAGSISGGQTLPMNLTLTVMADRLLSNPQFYQDVVLNRTLPLTTYTRVSGKVTILFIKIHVVSYASCNQVISVTNRNISSIDCSYKTKL